MNLKPIVMVDDERLDQGMAELVSAEDFLEFFDVPFDPRVVQVNRLHIMQRYHDYLIKAGDLQPYSDPARRLIYSHLLDRAYSDFVTSDAKTEKVFKVFRMNEPQVAFVSIDQLLS